MPELPEILILSQQMAREISGKQIACAEINQPKCLNVSSQEFISVIEGKTIGRITSKGKWLFLQVDGDYILISLGMGGDVLFFKPEEFLPEKYHFKILFNDKSGFTIRFWWFGKIHFVSGNNLNEHSETSKLGISPLDSNFTFEHLENLLNRKQGNIKSFLLDQKNIAGIGNVYLQEILFEARLHPKRKISSLSKEEIRNLYSSIIRVLNCSIDLCGLAYEKDFYGNSGKYSVEKMSVGYKENQLCPVCHTLIEKIKTGRTSTYICPKCQRLND